MLSLPARAFARVLFISCAIFASLSIGCVSPDVTPASKPLADASTLTSTAAATQAATEKIRPPFYQIEGRGGADLAILGTVHLGPTEGWAFPASITDKMVAADRFILEIDLRSLDEGEVGDLLAALVILPVGTTLDQVISPETAKLLEEQEDELAALGFPKNARRHKKPWYLATSLITLGAQRSGYDPGQAVENAILDAAGARPMMGLETFEDQLRLLDSVSLQVQDLMLRDTLERRANAPAEIKALIQAWQQNDQVALTEIAYQGIEEFPEFSSFYDALLKERNQRWVETLSTLLEDPAQSKDQIFVGVGALHLVGPDSVIDLLRQAGYRIEAVH